MGLADELKKQWKTGGVLTQLIIVNVAVFVLINVVAVLFFLMETQVELTRYLGTPASLVELIKKPWTLLTYMFVHEEFLHLFFNMLILFFLGRIFLDLLGGNRLLGLYVLGGLAGVTLYLISFNTFPVFSSRSGNWLIGASASVMAVVFGIAAYRPNYEVSLFLPRFVVKLWWIAAFYFITDFIAIQGTNPGGSLAHLGGGLFGFLFASQLKKGNDIATGVGTWIMNLGKKTPKRGKMHVAKSGKASKNTHNTSDEEQARLDHILDKIGKSGYESLSKTEKDFLFKASNE